HHAPRFVRNHRDHNSITLNPAAGGEIPAATLKITKNSSKPDLHSSDTGDNNTRVPSRNLQRDMKGPAHRGCG
ncbi:MAG: hypothetical protein WC082_13395, partial [Victivallales bacterium]